MRVYDGLSDSEKAKYLLPLTFLQLPEIFTKYNAKLGREHFYSILPVPPDYFKSEIRGLGAAKVDLIKRSLEALDLPLNEALFLPEGFDPDEKQAAFQAVQTIFLKENFQSRIFSSVAKIHDIHTELAANLDMIVHAPAARSPDVEQKILLAYWGWDGQPSRTMEEVGALALSGKAVSRQRIEQSEWRARQRLKKEIISYTGYLDETISALKSLTPIHVSDIEGELLNIGISISPIRVDGLLNAAQIILGDDSLNLDKSIGVLFAQKDTSWFKWALSDIGSMVEGNGACKLDAALGFKRLSPRRADFLKGFLGRSPEYHWLDDDKSWVFKERKRNRVENTLEKIFSVTDKITPKDCAKQVNKDPRIEIKLTAETLIALSNHFDFVRHEHGSLVRNYNMSVPFGGAERAFLSQMSTDPKDYDKHEIETYAASMDPPIISPIQVLSRSPIVKNVGYDDWVLIGDKWLDTGASVVEPDNDAGRKEAIDNCLDQMWRHAFGAAGQSGKIVKTKRKEKLIGFTKEEFKSYCYDLMRTQGYICKLTQLPLDVYCLSKDYMPSADRIDSEKGYVRDNIQITCSFVNGWKSNHPNEQFLRLLSAVKSVSTQD